MADNKIMLHEDPKILKFKILVEESPNIVFFGGAGVSTESGIPDFRSKDGLYSPSELRANMQPRNFSEWYDTFGVQPTDKMYIPEEKRIIIW